MSGRAEPSHDAQQVRQAVPRIGRWILDVEADTWWWSDGTYEIHGFAPGEIVPTLELVLSHAHPGDVGRVRALLRQVVETGQAGSVTHRLLDARRRELNVLTVCHGTPAAGSGEPVRELHGYLVDVTEVRRRDSLDAVQDAVHRATEHRAVIEQGKGILMSSYGLSADTAFELLAAHSQHANVKLRDLAQQLVDEAQQADLAAPGLLHRLLPGPDASAPGPQ